MNFKVKPGDLVKLNPHFYPQSHGQVGLVLVIGVHIEEVGRDGYSEMVISVIPTSRINKSIMTFYVHDLMMVLSV